MTKRLDEIQGTIDGSYELTEVDKIRPSLPELVGSHAVFSSTILVAPYQSEFNLQKLNDMASNLLADFVADPLTGLDPTGTSNVPRGEFYDAHMSLSTRLWIGVRRFTDDIGEMKVSGHIDGEDEDIEIGVRRAIQKTAVRVYPSTELALRVGSGELPEQFIPGRVVRKARREHWKSLS